MRVVPCDFRPARFVHPNLKGYWVHLYLLFDGQTTYTFFHQSDMLDNSLLAIECGRNIIPFHQEILVTPTQFSDLYNKIEEYVSDTNHD